MQNSERSMPDRYVEKSFLYLVLFSLVAHIVAFAVLALIPDRKESPRPEPMMVDLRDLPEVPELQPVQKAAPRISEKVRRVPGEISPRGFDSRETVASAPARPIPAFPSAPAAPLPVPRGSIPAVEIPGGDLFRKRSPEKTDIARLFPSAGRLAAMENTYRKKYEAEVEEGDASFLNTEDVLFGSFLRRFETAIYGVWRYPSDAARMGIEGVTPVKITFNRKGEVEKVQLLESSGSKILDDEVLRTLHAVGPMGALPRGYPKENFHLIAFFRYGIVRGAMTGTLH
jgi:periplasmic protein TonB